MKITKEMLRRANGRLSLLDPCVICGGKLAANRRDQLTGLLVPYPGHEPQNLCGHSTDETAQVINEIRSLKNDEIQAIQEKV